MPVVQRVLEDGSVVRETQTPYPPRSVDTTLAYPTDVRQEYYRSKYGFVDKQRGWVVLPEYDRLPKEYAPSGMAAKRNKRAGIIDGYGRVLVPFRYYSIERIKRSDKTATDFLVANVEYGKAASVITVNGQAGSALAGLEGLQSVAAEGGGLYLAKVSVPGSRGRFHSYLYDADADRLVYEGPLADGFARMGANFILNTVNDGALIVNRAGERLNKGEYTSLRTYSRFRGAQNTTYLKAERDGRFGLLDEQEREVLPFDYKEIYSGKDPEVFVVKDMDGKVGLFGTEGKFRIEPAYNDLSAYNDLQFYAARKSGGYEEAFSYAGERILPGTFRRFTALGPQQFAATDSSGLNRIYNLKGELLDEAYYFQVNKLRGLYARALGVEGLNPAMLEQLMKEQSAAQRQDFRLALIDLQTGERLTGFLYEKFYREGKALYAVRDGYTGTLNAQGVENNDWKKIK